MRPIMTAMTIVISLGLGGTGLHAQTWQMPPDSQRCPSKWGAGDQRGSGNMMKPETVLRLLDKKDDLTPSEYGVTQSLVRFC